MSTDPTIIYTLTDEAPLLATCAFLPVIPVTLGAGRRRLRRGSQRRCGRTCDPILGILRPESVLEGPSCPFTR